MDTEEKIKNTKSSKNKNGIKINLIDNFEKQKKSNISKKCNDSINSKSSFTYSTKTLWKQNKTSEKESYFKNMKNNNKFEIKKDNINFPNQNLIKNKIDIKKYLEPTFESIDYDEVIEDDKRTFFEYYKEKIIDNQMIINSFFINETIKPKPIKILIFVLSIDLYFLINAIFFSDLYISQKFNSNEKETVALIILNSIDRFIYSTMVGNIIRYIIDFIFEKEIRIKKILIKSGNDLLNLRYEMSNLLKSIINKIRIVIILSCIITIFTWYYITCFFNVYPHLKTDWIVSSLFIIMIVQILPLIFSFLETCIRFISIKFESEKLFKLSLLFP